MRVMAHGFMGCSGAKPHPKVCLVDAVRVTKCRHRLFRLVLGRGFINLFVVDHRCISDFYCTFNLLWCGTFERFVFSTLTNTDTFCPPSRSANFSMGHRFKPCIKEMRITCCRPETTNVETRD